MAAQTEMMHLSQGSSGLFANPDLQAANDANTNVNDNVEKMRMIGATSPAMGSVEQRKRRSMISDRSSVVDIDLLPAEFASMFHVSFSSLSINIPIFGN